MVFGRALKEAKNYCGRCAGVHRQGGGRRKEGVQRTAIAVGLKVGSKHTARGEQLILS